MGFPGASAPTSSTNAGDQGPSLVGKTPCRRAWQPAPVFLPGESHGQRSLAGYSRGVTESDIPERLNNVLHLRLVGGRLAPGCVARKLWSWGKSPLDSAISALLLHPYLLLEGLGNSEQTEEDPLRGSCHLTSRGGRRWGERIKGYLLSTGF